LTALEPFLFVGINVLLAARHAATYPRYWQDKAGLLDEIAIDLVPVLLGGGVRLFEHLAFVTTWPVTASETPGFRQSRDAQRPTLAIQVEMFAPPTAHVKRGIQAEAHRLGEFLGAEVELTYGSIAGRSTTTDKR